MRGPAAEAGADDEVGRAVAVEVRRGDAGAAAEVRCRRCRRSRRLRVTRPLANLKIADAAAAALVGADDDVVLAVAVDVGGREEEAAGEVVAEDHLRR